MYLYRFHTHKIRSWNITTTGFYRIHHSIHKRVGWLVGWLVVFAVWWEWWFFIYPHSHYPPSKITPSSRSPLLLRTEGRQTAQSMTYQVWDPSSWRPSSAFVWDAVHRNAPGFFEWENNSLGFPVNFDNWSHPLWRWRTPLFESQENHSFSWGCIDTWDHRIFRCSIGGWD